MSKPAARRSDRQHRTKRWILIYGLGGAAGAFVLQWLEYRYFVRLFPAEIYVSLIALLFTLLGIWVGSRLARRSPPAPYEKNRKALAYLGISDREIEVLELVAKGHSNKEIAARLYVSINTVKTHLARLYAKLEVSRRTQAVDKARSLRLLR